MSEDDYRIRKAKCCRNCVWCMETQEIGGSGLPCVMKNIDNGSSFPRRYVSEDDVCGKWRASDGYEMADFS